MNPEDYGLIEMVLFFGLILAILFWQLYSVKRSMREDARKKDEARDESVS